MLGFAFLRRLLLGLPPKTCNRLYDSRGIPESLVDTHSTRHSSRLCEVARGSGYFTVILMLSWTGMKVSMVLTDF